MTYKVKIEDAQTVFVIAPSITEAYKSVEAYHKGKKIAITSARKRCTKPLFKKQWS